MKSREVVFAPEARRDLLDLYDTLATVASSQVALGYVGRIEAFCRRFDLGAERGQRHDDIRPGLRVTGFERRIAVAFVVEDDHATIPRLFYGGRDWENALADS